MYVKSSIHKKGEIIAKTGYGVVEGSEDLRIYKHIDPKIIDFFSHLKTPEIKTGTLCEADWIAYELALRMGGIIAEEKAFKVIDETIHGEEINPYIFK